MLRTAGSAIRATSLAAGAAAFGVVLAVVTASPAWAATWAVVTTPNAAGSINQFAGVDAPSSTDAWAVGMTQVDWSTPTTALAARWNGTAWSLVSTPAVTGNASLNGVDASSTTNAWAVGAAGSGTLTERWNGTAWSVVASPTPAGATGAVFRRVKTLATDNAWAVGEYSTSTSPVRRTLIAQWNGTAWSQVTSPNPDSFQNLLVAIDGTAANDLWALGNMGTDGYGGETVAGLILRWNGTAWSQVSLPGGGGCCTGFSTRKLHDLVAVASNDVWVVGTAFSFSVFAFVPYWVHWNGTAWTDGTLPSPSAGGFRTVTALSATKVYAFGGESSGPLIAKWNGSAWSRETAPSTPGNAVDSAVTGTATVWAVGAQAGSGSNIQTFAIRTTSG